MVGVSVQIDEAALKPLADVLERVARETPERLVTETRRAALYLCQALKKRTRRAPKKIPKAEWAARTSWAPPRYAHSNSKGRALLRRWTLARKLRTPDAYSKHYFVYTKARRGADGKMVGKNEAEELRELLRVHGGIQNAGLAKASWGWLAKRIYNAADEGALMVAFRTKKWRRDPRRAVTSLFRRIVGGASADLVNALDYISAACPPAALEEAAAATARRLEHNIANHIERAAT